MGEYDRSMRQKLNFKKIILIAGITATVLFNMCYTLPAAEPAAKGEFHALKQQLIKDGFDPKKINNIYTNKAVKFTTTGTKIFFYQFKDAEKKRNYSQFSQKASIAKASSYITTHTQTLARAQKEFKVDKTIITAILLVETQLGTYPMKHLAINMLSSLSALSDNALKEKIWLTIPQNRKPKKGKFIKRADTKKHWAYKELKALLTYMEQNKLSPETVKGSYAGAIGFCQFMPSNIPSYASDGNKDGKIDLLNHEDAIFSVARYLKKHGWKPGLTKKEQGKVIHRYNHDWYYVEAIQTISEKLKKQQDKK